MLNIERDAFQTLLHKCLGDVYVISGNMWYCLITLNQGCQFLLLEGCAPAEFRCNLLKCNCLEVSSSQVCRITAKVALQDQNWTTLLKANKWFRLTFTILKNE